MMTKEEIIEMARQAGFEGCAELTWEDVVCTEELVAFAKLVAEKEREVVANWIMDKGFATGHGDSIVDLLDQLEWQIAQAEREACAKDCESMNSVEDYYGERIELFCAEAIRARGQE